MDMNTVMLIGRLTKDPELRYIPSTGNALTTFSLAVNRDFKTKDGQRIADFFNIVVWGKSAEYVANYLSKGRLAAVRGRIENRSYETKEGEKRYITEIIAENVEVLEWGDKGERAAGNTGSYRPSESASAASSNVFEPEGLDPDGFRALDDEDVPF